MTTGQLKADLELLARSHERCENSRRTMDTTDQLLDSSWEALKSSVALLKRTDPLVR